MSVLKTKFAARAAHSLRANATDAERKLWGHLRNRKLMGFKFVRQQPVGPYIADFACREADLVIELDGSQHVEDSALVADTERTKALAEHGYRVIRFWNNDVLGHIDDVTQTIAILLEKAPAPGLRFAKTGASPEGRGVPTARFVPGRASE